MSETTEHYDRVRRFMQLAGQSTPDAPTEMDAETRELRARLLVEEAFETIQRGLGINVYAQGWPEERIQMLMGHEDVSMTRGYLAGHEPPWEDVDSGLRR